MDYKQVIGVLQDMVARSDGDEFIALRSAIDAVIQVRAFEESDKWTPTEHAIPSTTGAYLVTCTNGNVKVGHFSTFNNKWTDARATAWQPLPKPWKGDEA